MVTEAAEKDSFANTAMFPPIAPYEEGFLKVDSRHTIYYHCYGNKAGKPVLFVHGGPGGGTQAAVRSFALVIESHRALLHCTFQDGKILRS